MKLIWPVLGGAICLATTLILFSGVIVLSLIPLFSPERQVDVSTANRTVKFEFGVTFTKISKRDLSNVTIDYVDAGSLPYTEIFLRNILRTSANLSSTVSIKLKEIAILYEPYNTLYFVGQYVFDIFCKSTCQSTILNKIPGNFSLSTSNITLSVLIHQSARKFRLLNFAKVDLTNIDEEFNLTYTLKANSNKNTKESKVSTDESIRDLVGNTLKLVPGYKNIPFSILENNMNSNSNNSTMLTVRLKVHYPAFYVGIEGYFDQMHDDLPSTLFRIFSSTNFTVSIDGVTWTASDIAVEFSENLAPVALIRIESVLDSKFNDKPLGIIKNQITVTNITNTIKNGFDLVQQAVEVDQISIYENPSSSATANRVLVVVIRFIFDFLQCNRECQKLKRDTLLGDIMNTMIPVPFSIYGIDVIITEFTIYSYDQDKPLYAITSTTSAATTVTGNFTHTHEIEAGR